MRLLATIDDPLIIERILTHLGVPTAGVRAAPEQLLRVAVRGLTPSGVTGAFRKRAAVFRPPCLEARTG
jgi:hypothetical protein